ncbi:MAG TPA: uridine kinase [Clostridiaceae bacterium]|nr:uridine kinase [Clostridiaceae bacterium]
MDVTVIGIAGGTSSGKSTLVDLFKQKFGDRVAVISQDAYYQGFHDVPIAKRRKLNYDHPEAFDLDLMVEAVTRLKSGKPAEIPVYNFVDFCREAKTVSLEPRQIVLCEGLLVLWYEPLRRLFDLKLFVDEDSDLRLIRRIRRDLNERGRSLDSVLNQYEATVKPMHEQFILPSKRYADIILPVGVSNKPGTGILLNHLQGIIDARREK